MKRFALVLCLFAVALPAAAHTLFLDVDGEKVQVEVSGPPVNSVTTEGNSVAVWKPEDAEAIAAQLSRAGLDWAIPSTLGALRVGDRTPTCLTLDLDDYGNVSVTLPGKVVTGEGRRVVWSPAQIEAVQAALRDIGREDALGRIFGLRIGSDTTEAATVRATGDTVLSPGCGECLNGKVCSIGGSADCCSGSGTACTKCKTCAPKGKTPQLGTELP